MKVPNFRKNECQKTPVSRYYNLFFMEKRALAKEADALYLEGKYNEAISKYKRLIPLYEGMPSHQLSFEMKIFSALIREGQFDEAGTLMMTIVNQIWKSQNKVLIYSIPQKMKYAYACFVLSGNLPQASEIISHELVPEVERQAWLGGNLYWSNLDPDERILKSALEKMNGL